MFSGGPRHRGVARVLPLALPEWRASAATDGWAAQRLWNCGTRQPRPSIVRSAFHRPQPASSSVAAHLAAAHGGARTGYSAARRGRGLSGAGRQRTMAVLPLAGSSRRPHVPGTAREPRISRRHASIPMAKRTRWSLSIRREDSGRRDASVKPRNGCTIGEQLIRCATPLAAWESQLGTNKRHLNLRLVSFTGV